MLNFKHVYKNILDVVCKKNYKHTKLYNEKMSADEYYYGFIFNDNIKKMIGQRELIRLVRRTFKLNTIYYLKDFDDFYDKYKDKYYFYLGGLEIDQYGFMVQGYGFNLWYKYFFEYKVSHSKFKISRYRL